MTGWWRRACDRAFNLGLTIAELTRRVHGATGNRRMVKLALDLEEQMQVDEGRSAKGRKPDRASGPMARPSAASGAAATSEGQRA